MRERPLAFSADMVRRLLDNRKTQTRRLLASRAGDRRWLQAYTLRSCDDTGLAVFDLTGGPEDIEHRGRGRKPKRIRAALPASFNVRCPHGRPGDRIWVREPWWWSPLASMPPSPDYPQFLHYAASEENLEPKADINSGIFMPRWASRISLEITSVRLERLQDISQEDAIAEGGPPSHRSIDKISREFGYPDFSRSWFAQTWDLYHRQAQWISNPLVWVIGFRRLL